MTAILYHVPIWFQSTRPRGARLNLEVTYPETTPVSIHAPARGATESFLCIVFDTHVSIHAPARGATESFLFIVFDTHVSIHAPARGATMTPRYIQG